ncbi:beta strand repeat-containing protein [Myroides profundi]|uniref:beta strand repeat-containing protein n=1 Tax=Myroides profundi TaxID=480520 RepID=UPI0005A317D5|nr:hypothetical protein [Myroides profundi]AJH15034.1 hypothetical protein MPR_1859 [Myroides profundi]
MKKRLLPVALLLGTFATNAQVGIGTATPNKSAELLIESKDRGLLIPNVALESTKDKVTIRNGNVQSLLVYATKKQGDITPGYYYWDIDKWSRLTADKDIPQIVVNNFEEIVNMDGDKVKNIIKNIVKNTEGNVIYEGDKFYTYVKDGDKIIKQEIKEKLTTIVHDEKTGDYIYYNENSVDRNGNIIGEGVRIKIKETVINKFGDIINNKTVQEHITNYLDGTYVGGNVYYDGDKLTYVTKEGERKEVSIKEVITANESKTAIITVANKQYYVSEEYLIANNDIIPSNVDPLNLSKGIYAIDVVGGVINNFEEIVTKGPITVDGRTFNTINDYIKYITESKGGFTKIVYDQTTGDVIFQEWNEVTQKFENVDNSKFSTIVKGNETITTLVDNQDGTYTYTSEDGTTTLVDIPSSVVNQFETIVKQPVEVDGRTFNTINDYIKYVTESKGGFTKIVYDQTTGDVIFQEWNEVTQKFENVDNSKFSTIVKGNETITLLVPNTNGTFTYYNESQIGADGHPKLGETGVTIDPKEVSVSLNTTTNKYEFKNSQGDVIGEIDTNAKAIAFDNSTNGFTSTNVQEALEELKTKLDGTSDTLVNNNDGTYTHTTVAGDIVIIDANTTKVEVLDGVYTFKNAKGDTITSIDTNAKAIAFDDSKSNLGADNVQDAIDNLLSKVGSGAGVTLVDNNDGTITLKSDDNTVLGTVSKGSLTNNNDGTYTYDNGDGTPVTFDTKAKAIAFDNSTNGFISTNVQEALEELKTKLDGTSDTLVNNNDGTYTHTTVAGDVVIIDANTTKVEVLDGVYTFKNAKGDTITSIDTNAKAIAFDDSKSKLGADNVQDAIDNLLSKVGSGAGVTLVDNNDGTITLKSDDNTVLGTVSKGSLTNNNDGTYTYDNGDGTPVTFDTNAKAIAFDNSTNGFTSTNVQEALEELKTKLDGTSDTLVNNNDGTYTHTTVAGDVVIIDANTTKVEVLDGVYTFKNAKGDTITSIDTNAKAIAFDDSKSKLGADNVQDAIDNLLSKVGSGAGVTLVDNNDGTITLKSDDNTVLGTVSKGSLTNNNDGTYTYDNGDGTPVTFDTNAKAIAFDNSTNGFTSTNVQEALEELKTKLDGTSDTLVNNNDGTYTHTTVAGEVVIIDANTTKVEVLDGVYTFKNGKGDTITSIDTNAKAIAFDDSKSNLGADNVQDAIDNLLSKVGSGAGVTLVDNNDGTITLKSDDNTVLGTVSKGSLTNNNDGTYTYDNGDGTQIMYKMQLIIY